MMNEKMKLVVAMGFAGLVLALFVPLQAIFLGLLLGLLFVPPLVALGSTLIEGAFIISKELMQEPEQKHQVISA